MEEYDYASASGDEEGARLQPDTERKEEGFVYVPIAAHLKLMQLPKHICSHDSPELLAVLVGPASCRQPVLLFSAAPVRDLPGPLTHPLPGWIVQIT